MSWIKFEHSGKNMKTTMSVRKNGQIALNTSSVTIYRLRDYRYAVLYCDTEARKIGIEFTGESSAIGAAKIRQTKYGISIPAQLFIDKFELAKEIKTKKMVCRQEGGKIVADY